jgi:periplasmic protein CpxP/Spy
MMTTFRKRILVGLVATALGAASVAAYAERDCGPMGGGQASFGEHGRSSESMKKHFDKRQAQVHDKLKLNTNQEAAWNAYIAKIKPADVPKRPDRAEIDKLPTPERMDRMLGFMKEGEKRMADRAAATKEFYAVLTPEQRKIFDEEFSSGMGRGRHRHGPY